MNDDPLIVIRIGRRSLVFLGITLVLVISLLVLPTRLQAQKVQESYNEKFEISKETAGIGVSASSDGKYVFVVGPRGILVSDDHGKTGSWVQTVRLK